jgi:DNA modification methylase
MKSDETGTLSEHVQLVRLPDLQAWTRNPHKHPESQLSTLASNIRTFGFTSLPVLAFYPGETRGFVSSGNGRLESLHLLRAQYPQNPPPGIDTDTDGEWLIPVRPMQFPSRLIAEAQGLSDNWIASMPGVEDDTEMLAEILHDLQEQEIDFSGLGKDMDDLAAILADPPVEPSADDDDAPEPQAEAVSRLGEVYELGPHRLVCGDSTSADSWTLLMGEERGDLVFTDPPYGVAYEGGHNEKKRKQIENDALEGADLTGLFHDSLSMAIGHSHNHTPFYVWYASGKSVETYAAFAKLPLKLRAVIQWYKVRSGLGAFMSQYIPNCEPCIYAFKDGHSPQWFGPSDEKTVWELQREGKNEYHPTQKPVALSVRAITNSSKPGQIVIDMFGGSGATLIGCGSTGRICRMMELDPRFCDVIRRRWTAWAKKNNREVGTGGLE